MLRCALLAAARGCKLARHTAGVAVSEDDAEARARHAPDDHRLVPDEGARGGWRVSWRVLGRRGTSRSLGGSGPLQRARRSPAPPYRRAHLPAGAASGRFVTVAGDDGDRGMGGTGQGVETPAVAGGI